MLRLVLFLVRLQFYWLEFIQKSLSAQKICKVEQILIIKLVRKANRDLKQHTLKYLLFTSLYFLVVAVSAQVTSVLKEVEISSPKYHLFTSGISTTIIDSSIISQYSTNTLSEVLSYNTPVFIKDYGSGTLATISFRGTSSNQTLVNWNGFAINSSTAGILDFALIPISLFDEISLLHGGASSMHGSGAMGGCVYVDNKFSWQKGSSLSINNEIGSFLTYRSRIKFNTGNTNFQSSSNLFLNSAENNFPFTNTALPNSPIVRQSHAKLYQYGFLQSFSVRLKPNNTLAAGIWYQNSDRQIPPSMLSLSSEASQKDSLLRTYISWNKKYTKSNLLLKAAYFKEFLFYKDEVASINSSYEVDSYQEENEFQRALTNKIIFVIGNNFTHKEAQVDNYEGIKTESLLGLYCGLKYHFAEGWAANTSLRKEIVEGYQPPLAPSLGFEGVLINDWLYMKGNCSSNFKLPTLNEKYWNPGGNPELKPEEAWNTEIGFRSLAKSVQHTFQTEVTGYYSKINNWIQWMPGRYQYWSPVNLKKVFARGIELSHQYIFQARNLNLSLKANYAYTLSTNETAYTNDQENIIGKQLIYTPLHNLNGIFQLSYKEYFFNYTQIYTGLRYTTTDNSEYIDPYAVGNLIIGKTFASTFFKIFTELKVNNIWNFPYQPIPWVAMPGRAYYINIQLEFNNKH